MSDERRDRYKEAHEANPPETWLVMKENPYASKSHWKVCDRDGRYIASFKTRREAKAALTSGFYFDLYQKKTRWMAGGSIPQWKPYTEARDERWRNEDYQERRAQREAERSAD